MNANILVVEDEEKLARFVELELIHEGYTVKTEGSGRAALAEALAGSYDLILLDIMLPELNGLEVLRRLKKEKDTPVILLTIRVALKLHSRQAGGAAAEQASGEGLLVWGPLTMDIPRHRVTMNGHEITLTNREFLMLQTLLENTDIVLSRDTLLEKVCGYEYAGETNVIDVYIRYLRSKIDDVFSVQMIRTVRGVGYVINKWEDCG